MLYVEQRAQNESEGDYIGFGLTERYDCVDWANWAAERFPGLPVYLMGCRSAGRRCSWPQAIFSPPRCTA